MSIFNLSDEISSRLEPVDLSNFSFNGSFHRWGKNKRYWLSGIVGDGGVRFGIYGDWSTGEVHKWCEDKKELSKKKVKEKVFKEVHQKIDLQKFNKHQICLPYIQKIYDAGVDIVMPKKDSESGKLIEGGNLPEYFKKKEMKPHDGLRVLNAKVALPSFEDHTIDKEHLLLRDVHYNDALVIPIKTVNGDLRGVQIIPGTGKKEFVTGSLISENSFIIGDYSKAEYIFICEGVATGSSIYQSIKEQKNFSDDFCVVCCFSAVNIKAVCKKMKFSKKVVFAMDNDSPKSDAGYTAYKNARRYCQDYTLKMPKEQATDWNDRARKLGPKMCGHSLIPNKSDFVNLIFLGVTRDHYYYFSNYKGDIVRCGVSHGKDQILALAPKDYWIAKFPKKDKEGNVIGFVIDDCSEWLRENCSRHGFFDSTKVKGSGFFKNEKNELYGTSGFQICGERRTGVVHVSGKEIFLPDTRDVEKRTLKRRFKKLNEAISLFCWSNESYGDLLLGWMMAAPFCGVLDWRPHIWLTGSSSSGKSWVYEHVVHGFLSENCETFSSSESTTEAGVRGKMDCSSLPLIFDEFESEDIFAKKKIKRLLALFRQSSSSANSEITKGTAEGGIRTYSTNSMVMLSSVNVVLDFEADRNRFLVFELNKKKQELEEFEKAEEIIADLDLKKLFEDHVCYFFNNFKSFYTKYCYLHKRYIREYKVNGHVARSFATLVSALNMYDLKFNEKMVEEFCKKIAHENESEEERCFSHFYDAEITYNGERYNISFLIEVILNLNRKDEARGGFDKATAISILARSGVRKSSCGGHIWVFTKHPVFTKQIMKDYPATNIRDIWRRLAYVRSRSVEESVHVHKGPYLEIDYSRFTRLGVIKKD